MSSMTVSVLLRLVDRLSGPARQATAGLKGMAAGAKAVTPAAHAAGTANDRLARSLNTVARSGSAAGHSIGTAANASTRAASAADRAAGAFTRMGNAAQMAFSKIKPSASVATVEAYARHQQRIQSDMARASSGTLMGGLALGTVGYPLKRASEYELRLTRLGNVAGYNSGDNRPGAAGDRFGDRIAALDKQFRADSRETRQYAGDIMLGVENLIARGMEQREALGGARLIGKAATATATDNNDLANMYYALRMNLGIGEARMPKAFDIATQAGKLGGFELKDMAKWFPELTVNYAALGMQGDEVGTQALARLSAMLQVAREGAATPDKAANNLANILQKLTIKETRKNFEKTMGIDFAKEMKGAVEKGEDPIMHLLGLVDQFMKKNDDNMFLLGDLFADRQALDGLRALLTKREKIDEITRQSLEAEEVINRDFDRVSRTFAMRAKAMAIAADNLANRLMNGPMGEGKGVLGWLEGAFTSLDKAAEKHPSITSGLMNVGIGLLGFSVASRAFSWIAGGAKLGLLGLLGTLWKFDKAGKNVAIAARALRGVRALLGVGAIAGLGVAGGLAGAGAGIARMTRLAFRFAGAWGVAKLALRGLLRITGWGLLASGAWEVYQNWDNLGRMWGRLKKLFSEPLKIDINFPELPAWLKRFWKAPFEENAALEKRLGIDQKPTIGEWWSSERAPAATTPRSSAREAATTDAEPFDRAERSSEPGWLSRKFDTLSRWWSGPWAGGAVPGTQIAAPTDGWRPMGMRTPAAGGYQPASGASVDIMARARSLASGGGAATAVGGHMASTAQPQAPAGIEIVAQGPQVMFKQAPPQISINAPISITMNGTDPHAVGAAVSGHLNSVARGALHDGVTE